jgi:shikimate dehydrogenase
MLASWGLAVKGKKTLVLGAGGSGRSVAVALKKAGANVFAYRRNQEELLEFCEQLGVQAATSPNEGGFDILINCTGVGMHDSEGVSPVTEKAFEGAKTAIDLIYTPEKSAFLEIAEQQGLQILNGAAMLFYQAYYADCLYTERKASANQAEILYKKYLQTVK